MAYFMIKPNLYIMKSQEKTSLYWQSGDKRMMLFHSACDTLAEWNPDIRYTVVEGEVHGLPYTHTAYIMRAIHAGTILG